MSLIPLIIQELDDLTSELYSPYSPYAVRARRPGRDRDYRHHRLCPYRRTGSRAGAVAKATPEDFKVSLDVQQFRPDELNVKVVDNHVVVEGHHEEREDEHGFVSRRFTRRYTLPENIDAESVSSSLTSDGVLHVTAAKKAPKVEGRVVPITRTDRPAVEAGDSSEERRTSTAVMNGEHMED